MKKFKCSHDWEIYSDADRVSRETHLTSILFCKKCKIRMSATEVAQIELWKYTTGIQKWISIAAIVISICALFVSAKIDSTKRVTHEEVNLVR